MTKLYPNFNFLRVSCSCGHILSKELNLKALSNQIAYECSSLKDKESIILDYAFRCSACKKLISRKIIIERSNSILIVY